MVMTLELVEDVAWFGGTTFDDTVVLDDVDNGGNALGSDQTGFGLVVNGGNV